MRKILITYVATKSIMMECDDNGLDKDGCVLYPRPVDPRGLTAVIHKEEAENAPELLSEWVANGSANVSVHVEEIS
jgi:hypothetical protein